MARKLRHALRQKFPVEDLMAYFDPETERKVIAQVLGITVTTVNRYCRGNHTIPWYLADRLACRLGVHPINIWGDAWIEDQDESTRRRSRKPATVAVSHDATEQR